uniref:Uncharacterized protein n=1 Tax=Gasterosteus aculeatus TaxID=69293 RepID=G3NM00_GASAC
EVTLTFDLYSIKKCNEVTFNERRNVWLILLTTHICCNYPGHAYKVKILRYFHSDLSNMIFIFHQFWQILPHHSNICIVICIDSLCLRR